MKLVTASAMATLTSTGLANDVAMANDNRKRDDRCQQILNVLRYTITTIDYAFNDGHFWLFAHNCQTPKFRLLGQLWALNCVLTPRKLAAQCSFAPVKNAFARHQFGNFVCALEKLICEEFPV
jgi:hypothetical protein